MSLKSSGRVFRVCLPNNSVFIGYLNEPLEPFYSSHYLSLVPERFKKFISASVIGILEECSVDNSIDRCNYWKKVHNDMGVVVV